MLYMVDLGFFKDFVYGIDLDKKTKMILDHKYLISIIIPVYNIEEYLPRCLDSLISQSYANIEIICINDESPDQSDKILKEYSNKDSRIIVINQKNQGVSVARTRGVKEAKGEWVLFVDGDDWIDTETCEVTLNIAIEQKVDLVFWGYKKEFENRCEVKHLYSDSKHFELSLYNELQRRVIGLYAEELIDPSSADSIVTVWGKLYRTKLIKEIEFVDLKLIGTAEDALFNLEAMGKASSAFYIKENYYHYRKNNASSVTSSYKQELVQQWSVLFKKMAAFIPEDNNQRVYNSALNSRISLSIIGVGLNEFNSPKTLRKKLIFLNNYLFSRLYRNAILDLQLKFMPIHWQVFFLCCKLNLTIGVYALLIVIKKIINR